MERKELKPYQNKIIRVRGTLKSIRNQGLGGSSQFLLTDVRKADTGEFLAEHCWVSIDDQAIANKVFKFIKQEFMSTDTLINGYTWDKYTDKHYIAKPYKGNSRYKHQIEFDTKVKCYANYTKYGLSNIENNEIELVNLYTIRYGRDENNKPYIIHKE